MNPLYIFPLSIPFLLALRLFSRRHNQITHKAYPPTTTNKSTDNPDTESNRGFDVFINFRGPDSRETVTDVLYDRLTRAGFHVFLDDEEIRKGELIEGELLRAITNSKIYITIFSKDYASSKWCLRELAKMIECWETSSGDTKKVLLPIFFGVDVSKDVKLRSNVYTTALKQHEKELGKAAVKTWRDALQKVAQIKGWDMKNYRLSKLADLIEKEVFSKLTASSAVPIVPDRLVGIDKPVEDIMKLLALGSSGVRFIVIHGMGGIGKTTLANAVFKKISSGFQGSCFIKAVRQTSSDHGMVKIQETLLLGTLNLKSIKVADIDDGKDLISTRLRYQDVLIVLDDVDERDHLLNLAAESFQFNPRSRIIITARNTGFLPTKDDRYHFYEMKEMDHGLALQLFSQHAFEKCRPNSKFNDISNEIVATTGGLPLSLQVIGSSLYNQDEKIWKSKLKKLKEAPHMDVQKTLMISYEALEYEQQQVFLDIACLFNNEKLTNLTHFWEVCEFDPECSIDILKQRSLIKVYNGGTLWMHDQLRDLGRALAQPRTRGQPSQFPTKYKRLWLPDYAIDALRKKEVDESITALKLGKLDADYHFTSVEFARATNLLFLELQGGNLEGDFNNVFQQLRWLSWFECPMRFKATNLSFKNLIILKLSSSQIIEDHGGWGVFMEAKQLKVMHLKDFKHLKKTPDFSAFLELERLIIINCSELEEIDRSIGKLKHLNYLEIGFYIQNKSKMPTPRCLLPDSIGGLKSLTELRIGNVGLTELHPSIGQLVNLKLLRLSCRQLEILPCSIGELTSLVELDLSESGVRKLPDTIGRLESLETLYLYKSKITQLPKTIGNLKSLKEMDLSECNIEALPKALVKLENLEELCALYCRIKDGKLPEEIGKLSRLRNLILNGTNIDRVPTTINQLSLICVLELYGIHETRQLSELPASLKNLTVVSRFLMSYGVPDLSYLTNLVTLRLCCDRSDYNNPPSPVTQAAHMEWLARLTKLVELTLDLPNLISLPTELNSLSRLQSLVVTCFDPQSLTHLPSSLKWLTLIDVRSSVDWHLISRLNNLSRVTLEYCWLKEIKFDCLEQVHTLRLYKCAFLEKVSNLSSLKELRRLFLQDCERLVDMEGLGELKELRYLYLSNCERLVDMKGLGELKSLECLSLVHCNSIERLPDLSRLKKLLFFMIEECNSQKSIPNIDEEAPCRLEVIACQHLLDFRGPYSKRPFAHRNHYVEPL